VQPASPQHPIRFRYPALVQVRVAVRALRSGQPNLRHPHPPDLRNPGRQHPMDQPNLDRLRQPTLRSHPILPARLPRRPGLVAA
jgi:hypothetical protein